MESIRYEGDVSLQFAELIKAAEEGYNKMIAKGLPFVRIVVSRHWASEGVWVEGGHELSPLSDQDTVYKTNFEEKSA